MDNRFAKEDIEMIQEYLDEQLEGTGIDSCCFTEKLLSAAEKDEEFSTVLHQWINDSSEYDDINVDGYLLSNLAERYDDMRLGVLISLYLLWLEKSQPMLEDICSFADESCYVDPQMLSGARCYQAVLFDEGWCFFSKEPELVPPESLVECELWRIIEQEPLLCLPISCQPDVGTHLIRRTNKDAFAIYVPIDELNGGDDK